MIIRRDFLDTSPYFIHPSAPAPLGNEAGAHHEARILGCMGGCDQGRGQCEPECAEVRSAQDAGKRMEPKQPSPAQRLRTAWRSFVGRNPRLKNSGELMAECVGWLVVGIAVSAAIAHVVAGGA